VPIIMRRPFLATIEPKIDIQAGTISFQIYGERVDLCFRPPTPSRVPVTSPPPVAPMPTIRPDAISRIEVFNGDGEPYIWRSV